MATYQAIQQRVNHIVIDLPASVVAQVPTLVNEAIRELQRTHTFKVCETKLMATTALYTRNLVAVPSNWMKPRSIPYIIDVDGGTRQLQWAGDELVVNRDYGSQEGGEQEDELIAGDPETLIIGDMTDELGTSYIKVYPLPDDLSLYADGNYRIVIPYVKYLTTLSASSSQNWFTNNCEDWIAFKAASMAFFSDWDEQRATVWTQLAQAKMKEIVMLDKKQRLAQVTEIVPQADARGSRLGRGDRYYRGRR